MADEPDLPDTLQTLSFDGSADAEAQAVVTDFLDYTEYLPSDLIRSFTLIRQLDQAYKDAAAKVHELTVLYGKLPQIPAAQRPNPQALRHDISRALDRAMSCREASYAEAVRINEVAKKHEVRLALIKSKLEALPKPPSRDPTPPSRSPQAKRTTKREIKPKLKLNLTEKKSRPRTLLVPGEVLPPGEADATYPSGSDEEMEDVLPTEEGAEVEGSKTRVASKPPKTPKTPKQKTPKPPRERRTGEREKQHHRVTGISTSNALAMLTPPPEVAPLGSKWRPWLKLTDFELATVRKSMKKSVVWVPSEAMIRRVLASGGRGPENYERAKREAAAKGIPFLDEEPEIKDRIGLLPGESDQLPPVTPGPTVNAGMKLNESKRLKKEREKELEYQLQGQLLDDDDDAELSEVEDGDLIAAEFEKEESISRPQTRRATAMQLDEVNKKISEVSMSMRNLFTSPVPPTPMQTVETPILETGRATRKRKRDSTKEQHPQEPATSSTSPKQQAKKQKVDKPAKLSVTVKNQEIAEGVASPIKVTTTTISIPLAPEGPSSPQSASADMDTKMESIESPPEPRKAAAPVTQPTAAQSRPRRVSAAPKEAVTIETSAVGTSKEAIAPSSAPRTSTRTRTANSTKAASAEPAPSRRELRELRRLSINEETTPGAQAYPARTTRSSGRRPVPGLVTEEDNGKKKVSMGRRKVKPKKEAAKKDGAKTSGAEEEPEELDPDEPTYCVCDDVSWGTMIACENDKCEKEWFHLQCVGLEDIPPRRSKWFCPLCREKLHVDVKGNAQPTEVAPASRRR